MERIFKVSAILVSLMYGNNVWGSGNPFKEEMARRAAVQRSIDERWKKAAQGQTGAAPQANPPPAPPPVKTTPPPAPVAKPTPPPAIQVERDRLQQEKSRLEREKTALQQQLQAAQREKAQWQQEKADFERQLQADRSSQMAAAQRERDRLQQVAGDLQRQHEAEMEQTRQNVEQGIEGWKNAVEQRDRTIRERDALLQQWMAIAERQREINERQGTELEQVQADRGMLGQLKGDIIRKQRRMRILSERAKWRRKILEKILEKVPESELVSALRFLEVPPGMDLDGKEYEYNEEEEMEVGEFSRSAPPELADEEAESVQTSAPPERMEGDIPGEIRARAEAIRRKFMAEINGKSEEERRNLGREAMEALGELLKEYRERGMGGRARPIIEGERRKIEANME